MSPLSRSNQFDLTSQWRLFALKIAAFMLIATGPRVVSRHHSTQVCTLPVLLQLSIEDRPHRPQSWPPMY